MESGFIKLMTGGREIQESDIEVQRQSHRLYLTFLHSEVLSKSVKPPHISSFLFENGKYVQQFVETFISLR